MLHVSQTGTERGRPSLSRDTAAQRVQAVLDTLFLRALCEPARVDIVSVLIRKGRSDIGAIAQELPQDRSVVSRHLQVLERAGIVRAAREGRHIFYELDGPRILAKLEAMLQEMRTLAPLCGPAPAA